MPKVRIGEVEIEMTVDEFVEFIEKTRPEEIVAKLKTLKESRSE